MESRSGRDTGQGPAAGARLRFGEFVLDTAGQQLLQRAREIPLTPKAFRVLSLLASHPGEVVTKERLLDEVWTDVHVLEGVVKVCIADLRRALGETAARPRHLHTVQRRGYRFEGPVVEEAAPAARSPGGPAAPRPAESAVASTPDASPDPVRISVASHGERRQLTVLACEVDGRDGIAAGDLAGIVDVCQPAIAAVVRSLGGRVTRDLEQGLVACFGYPTSHEDDAARAVAAALRILDRAPVLDARRRRDGGATAAPIALRLGVSSGPVEVPREVDPRHLDLGDVVACAQRLASEAEPGDVLVGDSTRRLVEANFILEGVGDSAFRAVRPVGGESRLDVADATALAPIIGREQELSFILDRWETVKEGRGQGLLVTGEAGIGKSRLVHGLHQRIRGQSHGWIELRASALHRNSSFHPVIEMLRHSFQLEPDDLPEEQIARIEAALEETDLPVAEALHLLANLLSLPLPSDLAVLQLGPELQRKRTLEVVCDWLLSRADRTPHVLVAEDLHWADPSTTEFLGMLLEQSRSVPLLVVATHRPEFEPPWPARPDLAVLPLTALTRKQVEAMVSDLTGGKPVPRLVREHIVAKADGVPLFVEELTKNLLESDLLEEADHGYERTDPLPAFEVPTTLQDSLEARLDRLGPAKELCQLAAALGREFSHPLLAAVSGLEADDLDSLLVPLLDAELLYRRGAPPRATYTFKHALIHETAYGSLLPDARRDFHGRIAVALEAHFPEQIATQPEGLARHFEEAGRLPEAIAALERAGRSATAASANAEAIAHLEHAIGLVAGLPEGPERSVTETGLQVAIGLPLVALRGSGTPEVEQAYARARSLSQDLGESPQLAEALDGLVTFYVTQSRLDDAAELAAKQLELAESLDESRARLGAHYSSSLIRYFRGDPDGALAHLDRLAEVFDPAAHGDLISVRGENIGACSLAWRSWMLWIRGHPDRAVEAGQQGIARAREAGHAYSLAYTLTWVAVLHVNRREQESAMELANAAAAIAGEHGFPIPLHVSQMIQLRFGPDLDDDERIAQGERALAGLATTGTQVAVPQILGQFAGLCLDSGRPQAAAGYLDGAFAVSRATGQSHWDAELHRLRGEVRLAESAAATEEAEKELSFAVDVARGQQARMLELRATTRLAALRMEAGRAEEGRRLLQSVYDGFTEGFETPDLREAAQLLA